MSGIAEPHAQSGRTSAAADIPHRALTVRAGLIGGLTGGVIIWIYEAIVWVGVQPWRTQAPSRIA